VKFNKYLSLNIISSLSLLFITTGCVPKNYNGSYNTSYSYHPYNDYKAKQKTYYGNKIKINNPLKQRYKEYDKYNNPSSNYEIRDYKSNPFKEKKFLTSKLNNKILPDSIESKAKSLLGSKYKYGASGPYQYDCSGFVKKVYASQGFTLPRTSKEQSKIGKYLRFSELKKGDMVFFKSNNRSDISHVGIFLGNGKFIHASSNKKKVIISSINSDYASRNFMWGRRVTNENRFTKK